MDVRRVSGGGSLGGHSSRGGLCGGAAVGALVVASTGAAPAALVLKLEIVALNNLRHGRAKEEVLPVGANRASSKATKLFLRK